MKDRTAVYSAAGSKADYCDARLSVHERIPGTTRPYFTNVSVLVARRRGSLILYSAVAMLCASGFVNNVIFADEVSGYTELLL